MNDALKQVLRRTARLEREYIGARRLLPAPLRRTLRRALGMQREPGPRHYIPGELGVRGFFAELQRQGVDCVVLRWFDRLPEVTPGDDIDLLVADQDLPRLAALLRRQGGPSLVPCDVYTVSGLPGSRYQGMPYYPPHLSRQILARGVPWGGLCRVPCPEDHFLSLAYHALYQKGLASGLPAATPGVLQVAEAKHDYAGVLAGLAAKLGLEISITMETLDEVLAEFGWRPPPQMLERLAEESEWVRRRFPGVGASRR